MIVRDPYKELAKEVLDNKKLSWKAKGIMIYVLTLTEEEQDDIETIRENSTEGLSAFRSGWKELEREKYLERYPIKGKGTLAWKTKIIKKPFKNAS